MERNILNKTFFFSFFLLLFSLGIANAQTCNLAVNEIKEDRDIIHESCPGSADGSVTVSISGGQPQYAYVLEKRTGTITFQPVQESPLTSELTYTFTGISKGSYRIAVYDSQLECLEVRTAGFLINTLGTTPPAVTIQGASSVCEEQAGVVYEVPSTEGSTYSWGLPSGASIVSGEGTHRIVVRFGTASGNVSVVETNSGGCKGPEASMAVEVLTKPATFTFSANGSTTFCEGEAGPELVLSGSEAGVSYALFRDNLTTGISVEGSGSAISFGKQSRKGEYQVWASLTEMGTCGSLMDEIVELNPVKNPSLTADVQEASCFEGGDGSINISVADGTPGYTYLWSNGATTEDISGLTAGTYNVTVTDTNGCTVSESFTISEPVALRLSQAITPVSCEDGNTGAIDITIEGGSPEYTYVWSNGATTEDLNELTAGTYEVTVTDSKGCTLTQSFTVPDGIVLSLTANVSDASCNGVATGAIELTVSGGSGNYSYSWSNGASTKDIGELTAGTYTVTVEDTDRGCSVTGSYTIEEPAALALTITGTDATSCGGSEGTADLSVSGGAEGYTYLWSNGATSEDISGLSTGTYEVTVTDAKGCVATESVTIGGPAAITELTATVKNVSCFEGSDGAIDLTVTGGSAPLAYLWSNGATTEDVSGLSAGTYSVTVTDAAGCTASKEFTITAPTTPIAALTIKGNTTACEGDRGVAYEVTATAGSTYSWSLPNGATIASGAGTAKIKVDFGSESGDIKVVETNSNGCSGPEASLAVKVTKKPIEYTLSVIGSTTFCKGEPGPEFVLDGSQTGVTYILYNPSSTTNVQVKRRIGTGSPLSFGRANEEGVYIVFAYVTDERSCTSTMKNSFTLTPITVTLSAAIEQVKCKGETTGAIDLTATGGTAPYTYTWDSGATDEDLEGLGAGTYTVTARDANGCTAMGTYTITEPAEGLSLTAELTQVKCAGEENGAIDLTVGGGTAAYTFLWSNGATTEDLENLAAGEYEVTVTDANNCTVQQSFSISAPLALSLEVTETHVTTCGGENGAIKLDVSGGTTGYTFAWSNGETTQDLTNLSAGLYSVTVTDGNECTFTLENIEITEPAGIAALEADVTDASCFEGTDGKIDLTITGGTAPYTYTWAHGANTEDLENLAAGTYTVVVKDVNGCELSAPFVVGESQELIVSLVGTDISSCGAEDGAIDLTVSGGTGEYTIEWSTGETTEDRSGLSAGAYSVVVTDASGCTATGNITLTEPSGISSLTAEVTHLKCFGDNTGSIDLSVVGSTESYTYAWESGETTEDIHNLTAGTYTVTVTDANGCTATESFTINGPANALSFTETISPVTCAGDNTGAIAIVVNGGTGSYSFSWSNGETTQNISELLAGDYELTVTDENGCAVKKTITVPEGDLLSLDHDIHNVDCSPGTGFINITVKGGSGNYSYSWSNGATTEDIEGLDAGTYSVIVTDQETNCEITEEFNVHVVQLLALNLDGTNPSGCGVEDGAINLEVSGGSGEYTYSWSNGATTQNLTDLAAGTYEVTVTDGNGCIAKDSFTLTDPAGISALTAEVTDVNCFGAETGAINVTVTGGIAPYTYEWNTGETGEDLLDVAAGTYTIIVKDVNGCTATETFTIGQSAEALGITPAITEPVCAGESTGAIDITVSGGSGKYNYSWNNGTTTEDLNELKAGTYEVTVTDIETACISVQSFIISEPAVLSFERMAPTAASSCGAADGYVEVAVTGGTGEYTYLWSNGATTKDISGLPAGVYSLTVTDAAGCTLFGSVAIDEPSSFTSINAYTSNVSCFGGSDGTIGLTLTGGVEPFTYLWSNGATTEEVKDLPAGLYGVTVSDANGCKVSLAEIPVFEPAQLELTAALTDPLCQGANNGSIDLTVTEGVAPYTYQWSNGATTENLSELAAGTYEVVVTDANGCQQNGSFTLNAPAVLTLTLTNQNTTSCGSNDGAVSLEVAGGSGVYTYEWSNGASTKDLSELAAGTYSVVVTDEQGCKAEASVTIEGPAAITNITATIQDAACGETNGAIDLQFEGGTAPFSFAWSNGAISEDISGLGTGFYEVVITDANGCSASASFAVNGGATFTVESTTRNVSCVGASDGTISLLVSGTTEPFTYSWNNGATTAEIGDLTAGQYQVVITDANGCSAVYQYSIKEPAPVEVVETIQQIACSGEEGGSISLEVSGGTGTFSFAWADGATTQNRTDLAAGTYEVVISDENGCSLTRAYTIEEHSLVSFNLKGIEHESCPGAGDGAVGITDISGGTEPYSILWSNGEEELKFITSLQAGSYSVLVTDANGCTAEATYVIEPATPISLSATTRNVYCGEENSGAIDLNVSGGTAPYTYSWSNGETTEDLSGLSAGTYSVTVTDANTCPVAEETFTIENSPFLETPILTTSQETVCGDEANPVLSVSGITEEATIRWYESSVAEENLLEVSGSSYTPEVTEAGTYTYYVTQSQENCETSEAASISFTRNAECEPACTINPVAEIRVEPGTTICADISNLQLNAEATEVGPNAIYTWFHNEVEITSGSGEEFISVSYVPSAPFADGDKIKLIVNITDAEFICNGEEEVRNEITLRVAEEIVATVSIEPVAPVCLDGEGSITFAATGENIFYQSEPGIQTRFNWFVGEEETPRQSLKLKEGDAQWFTLEVAEITENTTIRLEVQMDEALGCVTNPDAATYTVPVAEKVAPTVSMSNPGDGLCAGSTTAFTAASTNTGTDPVYVWYVKGEGQAEREMQRGLSASFQYANPATNDQIRVSVEVANANGLCLESTTASAAPYVVTLKSAADCQEDNQFNCGAFSAKLLSLQEPSCDRNNGELQYEISGGEAPYFVRYTFGDELVEQSRTDAAFVLPIINIPAGKTVKVFVRDSRGLECSLENVLEMAPQVRATLTKTVDGDVNCFGQASGKAKLVISGGNAPYQYYRSEAEGWVNLAGNEIEFSDLAAGIHNIMVRDNEEDDCNASAAVEILNLNPKLDFTFQTEAANCNDNIGKIKINTVTGGNGGPYKVKLAGDENYRDFDSETTFEGLSRGLQTVMVTDGVCEFSKQVMVGSPGLIAVQYDILSLSCESPALRAGLNIRINEALTEVKGPYLVAISQMNTSGEYVVIPGMEALEMVGNQLIQYGLYNGTYAIEVRAANMEGCPENIRGIVVNEPEMPTAITFTHNPLNIYCAGSIGGVQLTELKGKPNTDFTINLYQNEELVRQKVISRDEYAVKKGAEGVFEVSDLVEGVYRMMITQEQGGCEGLEASEPVAFEIKKKAQMLAAEVTAKTESFPERGSGSLTLSVQTNSGEQPYISSIYLIEPLFPGQFYESEGDTVVYDPIEATFILTYTDLPAGKYEIYVVDKNGCRVVMEETIDHDQRLFIPNVITPNGDGYNENFYVRNIPENGTRLIMTNRWGKVVYSTENYQNDWDGGTEPDGIYFYHLFVTGGEGMEMKGWIEIRRGAQP